MIGDVCSAAIRAGEEAVVPCTKVPICLRQTASITLFPSSCRRRVTGTVPLEQCNAVVWSPAVVRRVCDVCFPPKVEPVLAFLNRHSRLLPWLIRLRNDGDVGTGGNKIIVEFSNAGRLARHARHARVDEVVTPLVEAYNSAVKRPVVCDLVCVVPCVPGGSAACIAVSM